MMIELERFECSDKSTLGLLKVDGFSCFTLEDADREVPGLPVDKWKICNETAIPKGTYEVIVDFSSRFKREMPRLLDVPGFEGIRIHSGNTNQDTSGCILVGSGYAENWVSNSRATFNKLFALIEAAYDRGEEITIEVK